MNLTRREFGAIATGELVGAAGLAGFVLTGCPQAASVWNDIKTWLPKGITSFEAIVTLVDPALAAVVAPIATLVNAGFAQLSADVDQYIAAPAADKATWLAKVQLAFGIVTQNLQAFLTAIGQSTNPLVILAVQLANILLSTIMGFIGKIGPTPAAIRLTAGSQTIAVVPVVRNKAQFMAAFNAACVAGGHPELSIR